MTYPRAKTDNEAQTQQFPQVRPQSYKPRKDEGLSITKLAVTFASAITVACITPQFVGYMNVAILTALTSVLVLIFSTLYTLLVKKTKKASAKALKQTPLYDILPDSLSDKLDIYAQDTTTITPIITDSQESHKGTSNTSSSSAGKIIPTDTKSPSKTPLNGSQGHISDPHASTPKGKLAQWFSSIPTFVKAVLAFLLGVLTLTLMTWGVAYLSNPESVTNNNITQVVSLTDKQQQSIQDDVYKKVIAHIQSTTSYKENTDNKTQNNSNTTDSNNTTTSSDDSTTTESSQNSSNTSQMQTQIEQLSQKVAQLEKELGTADGQSTNSTSGSSNSTNSTTLNSLSNDVQTLKSQITTLQSQIKTLQQNSTSQQ